MKAKNLTDLLKKGDRIAVSNITGREASSVTVVSQRYCNNIIGGWALGKGGQSIETPIGPTPVYATFEELLRLTPVKQHPNKILIYSPPEAVYGEVKEVLKYGKNIVETVYIVTENVSIEVTAKIYKLAKEAYIDVLGCNTLGILNAHDNIRIGAAGGTNPEDSFKPGSVTVISNSGNMVNTISSYLLSEGRGISFGISTGKDKLILTTLKELLILAEQDEHTKIIVLYIEPGGLYEYEAIEMMAKDGYSKPIVVYIAGTIAEKYSIPLGHAGAVVEGVHSSATGKKALFDGYFGIDPFKPGKTNKKHMKTQGVPDKGIRVEALHHIPKAVNFICDNLSIARDTKKVGSLKLNPWFCRLGDLGKQLPSSLHLATGSIPDPYREQINLQQKTFLSSTIRQSLRNASKASSSDGRSTRIYGYSNVDIIKTKSFAAALILYWTGDLPKEPIEEKLVEMTLIASLTNGPGTISAQGAKLSSSAGNSPNTAMIATLATTGIVHGGNGAKAVEYLLEVFNDTDIKNPYDKTVDIKTLAQKAATDFKNQKDAAKNAGLEYEKIPCLGHPVFTRDAVNYDPREQSIHNFLTEHGKYNIFLEFYHHLTTALRENGSTGKVMAVNVDAAIASVWLAICWPKIIEKQMTLKRAKDIPFIVFALGRAAGGAGEFLDHQDFGTPMDMRIPVSECRALSRPRKML